MRCKHCEEPLDEFEAMTYEQMHIECWDEHFSQAVARVEPDASL